MRSEERVNNIRVIRMPDWQWDAVKAKAARLDTPVSVIVRDLLLGWVAYEGNTMPEQMALIATVGKPGPWERLAGKRIRELGKAGYLTPETAGYADGLRLAGQNLDYAMANGSVPARVNAADAWERALSRIVPAPVDSQRETTDDPWKALADDLRAATVHNPTD